ncbi:hypothetical protein GCM10009850_118180 [Nonomuraea monospora]|uniref:Uncharacterized protein n=1 Tax=Nonomuraea monospora TaxID=568818 RepID=A0ABN3D3R7_9ACTN
MGKASKDAGNGRVWGGRDVGGARGGGLAVVVGRADAFLGDRYRRIARRRGTDGRKRTHTRQLQAAGLPTHRFSGRRGGRGG